MVEIDVTDDELLSAHSFSLAARRGWFLLRNGNGIVLDTTYKIRIFQQVDDAQEFAIKSGQPFNRFDYYVSEPPDYDFDLIERWVASPSSETVDCHAFNTAWNLLNDICASVPWLREPFRARRYDVIYDKLFWGLNLPVFTPEGRHWTPVWSDRQVVLIRRVLRRTLFEFNRLLPLINDVR